MSKIIIKTSKNIQYNVFNMKFIKFDRIDIYDILL